jgi:hypothetical protein
MGLYNSRDTVITYRRSARSGGCGIPHRLAHRSVTELQASIRKRINERDKITKPFTARLDQRGRHDRFEHDPRAPVTEAAVFDAAAETLGVLGVPVVGRAGSLVRAKRSMSRQIWMTYSPRSWTMNGAVHGSSASSSVFDEVRPSTRITCHHRPTERKRVLGSDYTMVVTTGATRARC